MKGAQQWTNQSCWLSSAVTSGTCKLWILCHLQLPCWVSFLSWLHVIDSSTCVLPSFQFALCWLYTTVYLLVEEICGVLAIAVFSWSHVGSYFLCIENSPPKSDGCMTGCEWGICGKVISINRGWVMLTICYKHAEPLPSAILCEVEYLTRCLFR